MSFDASIQKLLRRVLIAFALFALLSCGGGSIDKGVVARVGSATLTWEELQWSFPESIRDSIGRGMALTRVREWVNSEALAQEARRMGLDTLPEMRRRIALFEQMLLAEQLRRQLLNNNALSVEEQDALLLQNSEEIKLRTPISIHPENIPLPE